MQSVQRIPLILLLMCLLAACGSTSDQDELPPIFADPVEVREPDLVDPPRPSGYIADPVKMTFHRLDCPEAEKVKPSIRRFFLTPFDALNENYAPCDYCEPMAGWK